jgi:RNA polymerase sigma-70 factor (ECF subfamily)
MLTDEALARGAQHGRTDDMAALIERHHGPLQGFLYRLTGGDRALAEDLTQDTFLRALRSIRQYRPAQRFKPWLYAIAVNVARDHFKRADTRRTESVSDDEWEAVIDPAEDEAFSVDESQRIAAAVGGLPPHQREAVSLRYYQDLSLAEIAEALSVPVGTVKSRLSLGLRRLRLTLEHDT